MLHIISFTVNTMQVHIYLMGVACRYLTCGSKVVVMVYVFENNRHLTKDTETLQRHRDHYGPEIRCW